MKAEHQEESTTAKMYGYKEYCTFFAVLGLYNPFSHTVVPSSPTEIISAWKEAPESSDF